MGVMFLRANRRIKDGKEHRYWSIVENRRTAEGRVVQRNVLKTLVCYRLIDPGSEWRLHCQWYEQSALGDLLGEDFRLVEIDTLYRCLDKVLEHKPALFSFLRQRWQDLFNVDFDVLLYDL